MCRELLERDLPPFARGDDHAGGQQGRNRLVDPRLAAHHGFGEEHATERLGDRTDLEQSMFVERRASRTGGAVRDESAVSTLENPDDDASCETAVDPRLQDRADLGVVGKLLGQRATSHRRAEEGDDETQHPIECSSWVSRAHWSFRFSVAGTLRGPIDCQGILRANAVHLSLERTFMRLLAALSVMLLTGNSLVAQSAPKAIYTDPPHDKQ